MCTKAMHNTQNAQLRTSVKTVFINFIIAVKSIIIQMNEATK